MRRAHSSLGTRVGSRQVGIGGSGSPIATLWTPNQLATLKIWFRGDDAGTNDGDSVSTWSDQSGNGNDATAVTAPTLDVATGLNGHKTVKFTGASSQYFTLPNVLSGFTAAAMVAALKVVSDPGTGSVSGPGGGILKVGSQGSSNGANEYTFSDGNIYDDFGSNARKTVGNPTPSLTSYHLCSFHSQSASWKCFINATQLFSTGTNTVGWRTSNIWMGHQQGGVGGTVLKYFDGNLAELCIFNEFLSDSNRQKIEGYLAYKYGLQGGLPVGHPYKSSPPTV